MIDDDIRSECDLCRLAALVVDALEVVDPSDGSVSADLIDCGKLRVTWKPDAGEPFAAVLEVSYDA